MSELFAIISSVIDLDTALTILFQITPIGWWMLKAAAGMFLFWVFFVAAMYCYRLKRDGILVKGNIPDTTYYLVMVLVAIAAIMDVIGQYTVAILLFWDLPRPGHHLITDRLRYYVLDRKVQDFRTKRAAWVCKVFTDLFDPLGTHCYRR